MTAAANNDAVPPFDIMRMKNVGHQARQIARAILSQERIFGPTRAIAYAMPSGVALPPSYYQAEQKLWPNTDFDEVERENANCLAWSFVKTTDRNDGGRIVRYDGNDYARTLPVRTPEERAIALAVVNLLDPSITELTLSTPTLTAGQDYACGDPIATAVSSEKLKMCMMIDERAPHIPCLQIVADNDFLTERQAVMEMGSRAKVSGRGEPNAKESNG